jgi:hypothetical protein
VLSFWTGDTQEDRKRESKNLAERRGESGGGGWHGAESSDSEKGWPSTYHSILSALDLEYVKAETTFAAVSL